MKPNPELPWRERLDELLLESRTRTLSTAEREELNATLRTHEDARSHAAQMLMDDAALAEELRAAQMESLLTADSGGMLGAAQPFAEVKRRSGWFQWRPLTAAAAGVVLGLFCATVAWAMASPRAVATMTRVFALEDGSFEKMSGPVPAGFPKQSGMWSGDESEIVGTGAVKPKDGAHLLRFVSPGADENDPNGRAISCDVFQLVDLRSLREHGSAQVDSVLELSAEVLDARPFNTRPSVTFFCQLFLFKGDPAKAHEAWPLNNGDALGSGSAQLTTLGDGLAAWKTLTARCLLPAQADYAVVQIAARPNIRPTKLESLFADDVRLTVKTQPSLPVKIIQH